MATNTPLPVSDEELSQLEGLLSDLKARAGEANDKGNVILLSLYAHLIKLVSPEIQRLRARIEREELAAINRSHKELRQARRSA